VLGKPIGDGNDYAESWEIADHEHGQSIVANGPLAGTSLHDLVTTRGEELLGQHHPQSRFPLIFKYLDCQRDLSVQVHPDDAAAAKLTPPDLGKTEAWVVLDAPEFPPAWIYAGLKEHCDDSTLRRALEDGSIADHLSRFEADVGNCHFIPAGTVHALGAGVLVAEIQQASDTTYRLYDWGRLGPDGKPRPLHVEDALKVIDYSATKTWPQTGQATARSAVERLAACDKFVLDRWTLAHDETIDLKRRFHILSVIEGALAVFSSAGTVQLRHGETVLLPACLGEITLRPDPRAVALDMYLPDSEP
jgi:mannose-6-phosphate isomerase